MKGRHWFIAMPGQCTVVSTEQCSSQWNHGVLSQPCGVIKSSTMSDPCTHAVCVTSSSPPNLSLCRENRETMCALCMASFSPMLLIECRAYLVVFLFLPPLLGGWWLTLITPGWCNVWQWHSFNHQFYANIFLLQNKFPLLPYLWSVCIWFFDLFPFFWDV